MLATLLRYWVLVPLVLGVAATVILFVYFRHHPKYRAMMEDETRGCVSFGLMEENELVIVAILFLKITFLVLNMLLTGLTITANMNPSLELPGLAWEVIANIFLKTKHHVFFFSQIKTLSTGPPSL